MFKRRIFVIFDHAIFDIRTYQIACYSVFVTRIIILSGNIGSCV